MGWSNTTTLFAVDKSIDTKNLGKQLVKNFLTTLFMLMSVKEQCQRQNLVGDQHSSGLHSLVMAWQSEVVNLPAQNDISNKNRLLCLQAINPLIPEYAQAPAGFKLSEHKEFPPKAEAGLKLVIKLQNIPGFQSFLKFWQHKGHAIETALSHHC